MDQSTEGIMEKIEENSSISLNQLYDVASSTVQYEEISDEMAVRSLVRQLGHLVGRPVSQIEEEKIVQFIINHEIPVSIDALGYFLMQDE